MVKPWRGLLIDDQASPNLRIKSLVKQTQDDEIHTVLPDDALTPGSSDDPNGMDSAGR
jgi:hypothetical protein